MEEEAAEFLVEVEPDGGQADGAWGDDAGWDDGGGGGGGDDGDDGGVDDDDAWDDEDVIELD